MLQGFGWKMLPGVFPTGKPLNMDVSYKVSVAILPVQHHD